MFRSIIAMAIVVAIAGSSSGAKSEIVSQEFFVDAATPEIKLFVRNKHADGPLSPDRIVLFVHGLSFPSESNFDLALNGFSWMDFVAQDGWDVYAMDVRAYGRSTRPPEMSQPPADNRPIGGFDTFVSDIGSVVDAIIARRHVTKVNLVGWSLGAGMAGAYTASANDKIARLVMFAPGWPPTTRPDPSKWSKLGAYVENTKDEEDYASIPPARREEIYPRAWFEAWWAAQFATDAAGAAKNPPIIRSPAGPLADMRKHALSGQAFWDPGKIRVPTLVIVGEWDTDTPPAKGQTVFALLTHAPIKRFVMLGEGTHMMAFETTRMALFSEVQTFPQYGALEVSRARACDPGSGRTEGGGALPSRQRPGLTESVSKGGRKWLCFIRHAGKSCLREAPLPFAACWRVCGRRPSPRTAGRGCRRIPPMPPVTTSGYMDVNDITVWYATFGAGNPLVLLHGGLGSSEQWAGQIPEFAKAVQGYRHRQSRSWAQHALGAALHVRVDGIRYPRSDGQTADTESIGGGIQRRGSASGWPWPSTTRSGSIASFSSGRTIIQVP